MMAPPDNTSGQTIRRHGPMNMVINTVLAMMNHGLNSGTRPNVDHVAESTFDLLEVKNAAAELWALFDLGDAPRRHSTKTRSECSALISDILDKLTEMGEKVVLPKFFIDPDDLGRIPSFNVEEVDNVALVQRLRRVELQISMMNRNIDDHNVQLGKLERLDHSVSRCNNNDTSDTDPLGTNIVNNVASHVDVQTKSGGVPPHVTPPTMGNASQSNPGPHNVPPPISTGPSSSVGVLPTKDNDNARSESKLPDLNDFPALKGDDDIERRASYAAQLKQESRVPHKQYKKKEI